MPRLPGLLLTAALLQGCAAITTTPSQDGELGEGLTYYLPKRDIQVTILVADKAISTVAITPTDAYPDLRRPFVLRNGLNALGKTVNSVGVGPNGLLTSSKSTVTSGVSDAASSLAGIAGTLQGARLASEAPATPCGNGTHVFIYPVTTNKPEKPCGLTVSIVPLPGAGAQAAGGQGRASAQPRDEAYSGYYYRQAEPFLVTVVGAINTAAIVYSPSVAPVKSLPIARTFFADAEADVTFTVGVPTLVKQTTDGELVGLLKLPAKIIAAYFAAIGSLFDAFKTRDDKQADSLDASIKLELAKMKFEACLKAVQAKDNETVVKLDCGK